MARLVAEREDVIPLLADVFRQYGYDGASLKHITDKTGFGKGSLYHFFPGGKEEMAQAVLDDIDLWFKNNIFIPLAQDDADHALEHMFDQVDTYFQSGRRICLVGAFALDETRDHFAQRIQSYFQDWISALAQTLHRKGAALHEAKETATEIVSGIQGALVICRAVNDISAFRRCLARMRLRLSV